MPILSIIRTTPTHLRYLGVGGIAFLLELATLVFLKSTGLSDLFAVSISFWVGFLVAFFLQKTLTFQNKERGKRMLAKQLVAYSLLVAFNYIFTLSIVALFSSVVAIYILRALTVAITTIWNYFIYRLIFRSIIQ